MASTRRLNPRAKREERARQAWIILIGAAHNRQTVTYEQLALLMFRRRAPGVLDVTLGHIHYYCKQNGHPPLNCIVVNKWTGLPGDEIPEFKDSMREEVYRHDWYGLEPPSPMELKAAWETR